MAQEQPEIRWVEERFGGGILLRAEHDGPCVFVDDRCSCGRLDLGIVRDVTPNATGPQPGQSADAPPSGNDPEPG